MKKLIIIIILLFLCHIKTLSQQNFYLPNCPYDIKSSSNYISANFCTSDFGYGLRYDKNFSHIGFYTSLLYTNVPSHNIKSLNNHVKIEPGINAIFRHDLEKDIYNFLFMGLSCNYYFNDKPVIYDIKKYEIAEYKKPISLSIGTGMLIEKFIIGVSVNFFTKEYIVNFGIKLY